MSELKGSRSLTSANSPTNAINFLVDRILKGELNTSTLVMVNEVFSSDPANLRVTITPLVPQIDGNGNVLTPTKIYDVPYSRVQGGVAALIIDPVPGDIGIALFTQRDIATVKLTKKTGQPGSLRTFDQADALYVGWVLNKTPTVFLEMTQDGKAKIVAPGGYTIESPTTEITGDLRVAGDTHLVGAATGEATAAFAGDVSGAGISLSTHIHISAAPGEPTSNPQ